MACDFGKQIYKDKVSFEKELEKLDAKDSEYIKGIKWPLETVYHVLDDRMQRVVDAGLGELID